jgi:hypothetical protein
MQHSNFASVEAQHACGVCLLPDLTPLKLTLMMPVHALIYVADVSLHAGHPSCK